MKILKKGGGVVEKRGEEGTKSMPHAPVILMYTDETVLVLNIPTLLKTLWQPLDVCSWLVYFGDGMLSP